MICSLKPVLYMCATLPCPLELRTQVVAQVGNLSFYTTEEQIYELFSKCTTPEDGGGIKRIIMGLDRNTRCVPIFALSAIAQPQGGSGHRVGFAVLSTIAMQKR